MKTPSAGPRRRLLAGLLAGILAGCQVNDSGTEIPNELRGSVLVNGPSKPAAAIGAEVRLVPVGHVPGPVGSGDALDRLILSANTDERGEYSFSEVPWGLYNVIAMQDGKASFRDSLFVTGRSQTLIPDTLSASGSLTGLIRLQPQHDPRTATVQVLGTQLAVNVDEWGRFLVPGMGEGLYRLRVVTTVEGYTPLYAEVYVRSSVSEMLTEPLEPFYFGIPVVEGLFATPEPDGTVRLQWQPPPAFGNVQAYLIFRDSVNAIEISRTPIGRTSSFSYIDTVYSRTPKPGQYPFQDTTPRVVEYRVRIRDMSGEVGPVFGSVIVEAIPPTRILTSGLWKPVTGSIPFGPRTSASLVVAQDRMWLLGGYDHSSQTVNTDIFATRDGHAWQLIASPSEFGDSSRAFKAAALRDSLWVVRSASRNGAWRLQLWVSGDGADWRKAVDSIPVPTLQDFELSAYGDRLWILGGSDPSNRRVTTYRSSPDGTAWTEFQKGGPGPMGHLTATLHRDRLFVLDSAQSVWSLQQEGSWVKVKGPGGVADRIPFLSHGDKLWILSGPESLVGPAGSGPNQVWNSPDGTIWTQVDAIAPFGTRRFPAAASFQGKIWVVGGDASGDGAQHDVWFYDGY